ncbi:MULTISPECIES: hypothetical protein [unclassified Mesorhizobium]|uniref:hypothetical protein n=1 Tax=unclassified Mesorhizobium TaxID=325217 RepID=UPI000FC9F592|nr:MULTISPECIES: hypothetical protein [unclassified Mesorhizobium]RUX88126.1 hypothetical protein EN993_33445 [Mesorhizobium sp. M7D.F.Ca.US.004.01.2.1]RVA34867.1 hypothetical protein EN935_05490 [Mesorhizobium sp. M7D.F.Ca.US.004.03.1.1]
MENKIQSETGQAGGPEADGFVRSLAEYANGSGLGVGISFLSHGMLITGITMSNVEFFEKAKEKWQSATPLTGASEVADIAKEALVDHAESMVKLMKERNAEGRDQDPAKFEMPYNLHLKDVRIMVPGQPSIKVDFWRCRIDEISGFTLGQVVD